jgi:hypothetical protein
LKKPEAEMSGAVMNNPMIRNREVDIHLESLRREQLIADESI